MKTAFMFPDPQTLLGQLQSSMPSTSAHTQAGLFPPIARAIGGRLLTPIQTADEIRTAFREYSRDFGQELLENKRALLPRIASAIVPDRMSARETQLLLNPKTV